jgi:hypothetical protein
MINAAGATGRGNNLLGHCIVFLWFDPWHGLAA